MNKTTKKILIWTFSIIGIGIIGYIGFVGYVMYTFTSGCGMDDGPFEAVLIDPIKISESAQKFELSDNAELFIENRTDSLSPILTLKQNGKVKWTLDTDTRNTKGYEYTRIWKLDKIRITKKTDPIELEFIGFWTYGAETGWMEIDREDGENEFCLSW